MNQTAFYPTINLKATGERIKMLRKARGYSVADIAEFMNFSEPQAVYKWQRGESLPTVDNLFALSRLFGTTIEDILVGDDRISSFFTRVAMKMPCLHEHLRSTAIT